MPKRHPDYPSHPVRSPKEQRRHDMEIQTFAPLLRAIYTKQGYAGVEALTNPGESRGYSLHVEETTLYPDILVRAEERVLEVYEVETETTVAAGSVEQWKDYVRGDWPFSLRVPMGLKAKAHALLKRHRVSYESLSTY